MWSQQDDAPESEKRNHKYAKMVNGMIDRKVVKQTVMTSVYGVTFIGARKQIQARLMEKFEAELKSGMLTKEQEQVRSQSPTLPPVVSPLGHSVAIFHSWPLSLSDHFYQGSLGGLGALSDPCRASFSCLWLFCRRSTRPPATWPR